MRVARRFNTKVVGVTFVTGYPENVIRLSDEANRRFIFSDDGSDEPDPIPVNLVRNPGNEHDTNAIEVHSDGLGMIGHIPAGVAERLAPHLDAGESWKAEITAIFQNEDHPNNPGIRLSIAAL